MKIYVKISLVSILLLTFYTPPARAGGMISGMFSYITKVVSECLFSKPSITQDENAPLINNNNTGNNNINPINNNNENNGINTGSNSAHINLDVSNEGNGDGNQIPTSTGTITNNNNNNSTINPGGTEQNQIEGISIDPNLNFEQVCNEGIAASQQEKKDETSSINNTNTHNTDINTHSSQQENITILDIEETPETKTDSTTTSPRINVDFSLEEKKNLNNSNTNGPSPFSQGMPTSPANKTQDEEDENKKLQQITDIMSTHSKSPQSQFLETKNQENTDEENTDEEDGCNSTYGSPSGGGYNSGFNSPSYSSDNYVNRPGTRPGSRVGSRVGTANNTPSTPITGNNNKRENFDQDKPYNFNTRINGDKDEIF